MKIVCDCTRGVLHCTHLLRLRWSVYMTVASPVGWLIKQSHLELFLAPSTSATSPVRHLFKPPSPQQDILIIYLIAAHQETMLSYGCVLGNRMERCLHNLLTEISSMSASDLQISSI